MAKKKFSINLDLSFNIEIEAKNNKEAMKKAKEKLMNCISKKWFNAGGSYGIHCVFDMNDESTQNY